MFPKDTNILVVDDSANIRQIVTDNLRRLGYSRIETAADANEAFLKLVRNAKGTTPITLVLSDLNMPGPSGLDFLRQVRETDPFRDMPFIMITTESEKQAVIQAAVHGVSGYVVKPFNLDALSKRLSEAWERHNQTEA